MTDRRPFFLKPGQGEKPTQVVLDEPTSFPTQHHAQKPRKGYLVPGDKWGQRDAARAKAQATRRERAKRARKARRANRR